MINKLILTITAILIATATHAQTVKNRPVYLGASYLYGNAQGKFKANNYDNGTINVIQINDDDDRANFYYGNAQEANGFKVYAHFPLTSKLYLGTEFSYMDYSISDSMVRAQAYEMFDTDEFFTHTYHERNRALNVYKLGAALSYRFDIKAVELQPSLVIGIMGLHVPGKIVTVSRKRQYENYHDAVYVKADKELSGGYYGSLSMRVNRRLSRSLNVSMAMTHDLGFAYVGYVATQRDFLGNIKEDSPVTYRQNVQSIHFDIGLSFCIGGGKSNKE